MLTKTIIKNIFQINSNNDYENNNNGYNNHYNNN